MEKAFDELVVQDHTQIVKYLRKFWEIPEIDEDNRKRHVNSFIRALVIHSLAEEMILYTALIKYVPNGAEIVAGLRDEHAQFKKDLQAIDFMPLNDPNFVPLLHKIDKLLDHHIKEEEDQDFPTLRRHMSDEEAIQLGRDFSKAKSYVGTHPHPLAPDHGGLLEMVVNMAVIPIDKLADVGREFVKEE
ncbi:hypothetical protein SeMB42_g02091 [Synchytrium endobioticum]|uniref:Hemerythrin-like domain-containing protein n=1 Tax=Synchytrium endobioticum TaxID=286115 RepID=A0A507DH54_9FUNG|nr:hypothetical protein SeMB42_g02091 [Synchytrium endobioticum]